MALINITRDTFDVVSRIKELDPYYYVVYNTSCNRYEVHNSHQRPMSFCITVDGELDCRTVEKLRKTRIDNMRELIREMDEFNMKLEADSERVLKDEADFKLREMCKFAGRREQDVDFNDAYTTRWI